MSETETDPAPWFEKAEHDLRAAELVLQTEEPLADVACYHAEQCAEKYLKGWLVAKRVSFRFVHELVYLVRRCAEADEEFRVLLDTAAELQDLATDVRYPTDEGTFPSLDDAQAALERAQIVRRFVRGKIGLGNDP